MGHSTKEDHHPPTLMHHLTLSQRRNTTLLSHPTETNLDTRCTQPTPHLSHLSLLKETQHPNDHSFPHPSPQLPRPTRDQERRDVLSTDARTSPPSRRSPPVLRWSLGPSSRSSLITSEQALAVMVRSFCCNWAVTIGDGLEHCVRHCTWDFNLCF